MLINSFTYLTSVYFLSDTVLGHWNTRVVKDLLTRTQATGFKALPYLI